MRRMRPGVRKNVLAWAALGALSFVLAGCSAGLTPAAYTVATGAGGSKQVVSGMVHGGQQPISGAVIQLYAVGMTGLKSAATPLIYASAGTITTSPGGGFSITGDWDCTSNTAAYGPNPLLYITATGGNPGMQGNVNNAASILVAALGPCSGVGGSTDINLDEMTTVAAVYALAPFMADATHIGASGSNAVGLVNAFRTAAMLVDVATGTAPGVGVGSNVSVPVMELNSLGDALASCVNTAGVGQECMPLFSAATPAGGTQPGDIVAAALNIVNNPANQASNVFYAAATVAPFQPTLPGPPNDWTLGVKFTGGGLSGPAAIALDASGNAWVANASGNSVTELSNTGVPLTGSSGYTGSNNLFGAQGIAVDRSGNVWVADTLLSSVVALTVSGGAVQSSASYTSGIAGPVSLAIDSANNVWVSNFAGASVTELNSHGVVLGAGPLTAANTLENPAGIAIDSQGNVWVADNAAWNIVEFGNNQSLLSGSGYSDGAMVAPLAVALDASRRAWVADNGSNSASLFGATGGSLLASPFMGGGLAMPASVAIDGGGMVWIANGATAGSISDLAYGQSAPASPSTGFGSLNTPAGIAVDASGSVWTANAGDNSVTEFVGIATPVATPLAVNAGP
jgi:streptogramin lyase